MKKISLSIAFFILLTFGLMLAYLVCMLHSWTFSQWYHFEGVWGTAPHDVFAVGRYAQGDIYGDGGHTQGGGLVLHYDGSGWSRMDADIQVGLEDVWGTSPTDVFAVGGGGDIWHYDGSEWDIMISSKNELNAVWGTPAIGIFAVGGCGAVLRYNGSRWVETDTGYCRNLNDIWGAFSDDVFAVGDGGTILHYDGNDWIAMGGGGSYDLKAVWGSSNTDVFAMGEHIALHYDGEHWSPMPEREQNYEVNLYYGIWGTSGTDVFAVGSAISYGLGAIWNYNGNEWRYTDYDHPRQTANFFLKDIWGSSSSDIFAVGTGRVILHYDGDEWSDMSYCLQPWWVTLLLVAAGVVALTGAGLWLVRRRRRAGAGQGEEL